MTSAVAALCRRKFACASLKRWPSVQGTLSRGNRATVALAHDLGVTTLNDLGSLGLSLVLGGGEVPPLDMAYAYGVFANDGVRQEKPLFKN